MAVRRALVSSMATTLAAALLFALRAAGEDCSTGGCVEESDLLSTLQTASLKSRAHVLTDPVRGRSASPVGSSPANKVILSERVFSQKTDCSDPPHVTCQCPNPDYPCRKASGDSCFCFSHNTKEWCEADGGHFCVRPPSCLANCELCESRTVCTRCVEGYMVVYGQCTKMPDNEIDRWLKAHNLLRCVHGSPPLGWSVPAANSAAAWARHLHETSSLVHSDSYREPAPAGPAGENLAWNYGAAEAATTAWYHEVDCCDALPGCDVGSCDTGHFTAVIWKGVRELGCATSGPYQVCHYRSGDGLDCNTANMPGCYEENVVGQVTRLYKCIASYDTDTITTTTVAIPLSTLPPHTPPTPGSSGLSKCEPVPKHTRGECETCLKSHDCLEDFRCHNAFKICVARSNVNLPESTCQTPKAGCLTSCESRKCDNAEGCDCECTLVGEDKVYDWMVWANLQNCNSDTPLVTCEAS